MSTPPESGPPDEPHEPDDLPQYLLDAVQHQDPDDLFTLAEYARELGRYRRQNEGKTGVSDRHLEDLESRGFATDPRHVDGVPEKAYLNIKSIDGTDYYYWQWRKSSNPDTWEGKYLAPVDVDADVDK